MNVTFRTATDADIDALARMNHQLIFDERHRNAMSLRELAERMKSWIARDYNAVLFNSDGTTLGYALYRHETDWVYLRHFFVLPIYRRNGVGRAALHWLTENRWQGAHRIRVEVLVGNTDGHAFWRAIGFDDYCTTMEMDIDI